MGDWRRGWCRLSRFRLRRDLHEPPTRSARCPYALAHGFSTSFNNLDPYPPSRLRKREKRRALPRH